MLSELELDALADEIRRSTDSGNPPKKLSPWLRNILFPKPEKIKPVKILGGKPKKQRANRASKRHRFIRSEEWRAVRSLIFDRYPAQCMRCGSNEKLCVDHIKPKSRYPELALEPSNMQVLCWPCNRSKGFTDESDYRPLCFLPFPQ